jgi:hypothetical protein
MAIKTVALYRDCPDFAFEDIRGQHRQHAKCPINVPPAPLKALEWGHVLYSLLRQQDELIDFQRIERLPTPPARSSLN